MAKKWSCRNVERSEPESKFGAVGSGGAGPIRFEGDIGQTEIQVTADKVFALGKFLFLDVGDADRFRRCPNTPHARVRRKNRQTLGDKQLQASGVEVELADA